MDQPLLDRLLREKEKRIKDQKEEIYFLRDALWQATGGQAFVGEPIPTEREGEPVAPLVIDGLCKEILMR